MLDHMRLTACPPKHWVDGKKPWKNRNHQ
jgi:hypothetical protein